MSTLTFSLELGSSPGILTSSSSNQMQNPQDMHQGKFLFTYRNLEQFAILELVKEVTERVNSFVIMEKKVPLDFSNTHPPGHSVQKKLRICLEPRDLKKLWRENLTIHRISREYLEAYTV